MLCKLTFIALSLTSLFACKNSVDDEESNNQISEAENVQIMLLVQLNATDVLTKMRQAFSFT